MREPSNRIPIGSNHIQEKARRRMSAFNACSHRPLSKDTKERLKVCDRRARASAFISS